MTRDEIIKALADKFGHHLIWDRKSRSDVPDGNDADTPAAAALGDDDRPLTYGEIADAIVAAMANGNGGH